MKEIFCMFFERIGFCLTSILTELKVGQTIVKAKIVSTWEGGAEVRMDNGQVVVVPTSGLIKSFSADTVYLVWRGYSVGWRICAKGLYTPEKVQVIVSETRVSERNALLTEMFGDVVGEYNQGADGPGAYSWSGQITLREWLANGQRSRV